MPVCVAYSRRYPGSSECLRIMNNGRERAQTGIPRLMSILKNQTFRNATERSAVSSKSSGQFT
jgi:hypothetical protein